MKFTLSDLPSVKPIINYPVLAQRRGLVALFTSESEATILNDSVSYSCGEHSRDLSIELWEILPIGQTVTLSN